MEGREGGREEKGREGGKERERTGEKKEGKIIMILILKMLPEGHRSGSAGQASDS